MKTQLVCITFLQMMILGSNPLKTAISRSFRQILSMEGLICKLYLGKKIGSNSLLDCAVLCSTSPRCLSYSYNRNASSCVYYDFYLTGETSCSSKKGYSYYLGPRIYREACRDTYVMNNEAQLCFKLYSERINWPSARAICHKDGAELISLNTEKKLQVFKTYILKEEARTGDKNKEYFLGGYLDITHRVWRWMEDYSIVKDYKYKTKDDRCLEFQSDPDDFGFDDTNCVSQFQPFVCEIHV